MNLREQELMTVCDAVDEIIRNARNAARPYHQATRDHIGPAFEDWSHRNAHTVQPHLHFEVRADLAALGFNW